VACKSGPRHFVRKGVKTEIKCSNGLGAERNTIHLSLPLQRRRSVMKRKLLVLVAILAVALWVAPASAFVQTLSLPAGSTNAGGDPVSASVQFTFDTDSVIVDIWNTTVNPKDIAQNISDLFFTLSTGQTSGSLTSSSGLERTVNDDGTFSDGSVVSTGWVLDSTTPFHLNGLGTAADVPAHTIIGLPDGSNVYSNANNSIANTGGPHNPFLFGVEPDAMGNGAVHFVLDVTGVTDATRAENVVFSFGTTPGDNVNVPIPPSVLLLGSGLLGLGVLRFRRS
jgi:hypothetical protein